MHQILFTIPREVFGWPVFGVGWLLAIWGVVSLAVLATQVRRHGWDRRTLSSVPSLALAAAAIFVAQFLMDDSGLPIRGYGVMMLISVVASIGLSVYRGRQMGLDPEIVLSLGTWLFVCGVIGARIFYVVQFWDEFHQDSPLDTLKMILNFTQGGLVVYGSLIGGAAALVAFIYKHRLPGLAMADIAVPGVVLGMGLGRIGCFFTGCCWGGPCDLPWAVTFPWGSPPHIEQAQSGKLHLEGLVFADVDGQPVLAAVEPASAAARHGLKAGDQIEAVGLPAMHHASEQSEPRTEWIPTATAHKAIAVLEAAKPGEPIAIKIAGERTPRTWVLDVAPPRSGPVHPTQIYSAIDALLLCGLLVAYSPWRRRDGEVLALFFVLHPISRFLLEILRREPNVFGTQLSIGQMVSVLFFVMGIAIWGYVLSRPAGTYRFT